MSLLAFLKRFPSDAACWAYLEKVRWPDGPVCPRCGSIGHAHKVGKRHYLRCNDCYYQFKVTQGTPFEGTHLPLRTWFTALYLVAASSKGISSVKLGEHLDVGQKTAWFLGQRIRRMIEHEGDLLRGIVEVDETYLGGKRRKRPSRRDPDDDQPIGRGGSRRKMVMVATERGGRARASTGETHSEFTIVQFIISNLDVLGAGGRIVLCTDALPAYRWIGSKFPAHLWVNHSIGEYVRRDPHYPADAHTNTAESFSAMLALMGVWHWFSIKHADRYLHEFCFRWNRRTTDIETRLAHIFSGTARRLRWRELVA